MTAAPAMAERTGAGATVTVPLRLVAARQRVYRPHAAAVEAVDADERYLRDLVESNGGTFRPEVLRAGRRTGFRTMALDLVRDLGAQWSSVDLVLLSHAVSDAEHRYFPACSLVDASPGSPLAFTVCDQGRVAPFSALRVAGTYVAGASFQRVLLLILDQSTVPWDVADRTELPTADVAVALLLDRAGGEDRGGVSLQHHAGVAAERIGAVLRAHLPTLAHRDPGARVIAGPGVPGDQLADLGAPVVAVPAGSLCAATWRHLSTPVRGTTVLVEYDARTRCLAVAAFEPPTAGRRTGPSTSEATGRVVPPGSRNLR